MHPHFPMGPQPSTPRVSRQLAVPFTCRSRPVLLQSSPLCIGLRKLATALSPRGQRHWNPRMLSRLYNNLDHFTHHLVTRRDSVGKKETDKNGAKRSLSLLCPRHSPPPSALPNRRRPRLPRRPPQKHSLLRRPALRQTPRRPAPPLAPRLCIARRRHRRSKFFCFVLKG